MQLAALTPSDVLQGGGLQEAATATSLAGWPSDPHDRKAVRLREPPVGILGRSAVQIQLVGSAPSDAHEGGGLQEASAAPRIPAWESDPDAREDSPV